MPPFELGIIGAGRMAEAILRGVLRAGLLHPSQIVASDPAATRRDLFAGELKVSTTDSNADVAAGSRVVLLGTKPYQLREALAPLGAAAAADTLFVSIAAGITSAKIQDALGGATRWRVVRAMPNTPVLLGQGAVGIAAGQFATPDDMATARRVFEAAADVVEVTEDQIDAVTAVSGSGPAYVYLLVEHMTRGGIELGLSADVASRLAVKTAYGAARMMLEAAGGETPADLRRNVTTPNGTTHAAISHMEAQGMPRIIVDAMRAAERRGKELGA